MQGPSPLARPWRDTPAAKPAFSHLSVFRGPARLSIFSPRLTASATLVVSCILVLELLVLAIFTAPSSSDSSWSRSAIMLSLLICAVMVLLARITAVRLFVGHSFAVSEDTWEVVCRRSRMFGLLSTRQRASGHTARLVAARVAAAGTVGGQLSTVIQFLEAPEATSAAPPTMRDVYNADATSTPLSLTEQEFIVAEVNRHLERTRGSAVPISVENTFFVDPGGIAALAPPSAHHGDRGAVPPLALPAFAGGAPLARPAALVPRVPLAGCRMSATLTAGGGCTVTLQRHLTLNPLLNIALVCCYAAAVVYFGVRIQSPIWTILVVSVLIWILVRLLGALRTVDQLLLGERYWTLNQYAMRGRVRRAGQWKGPHVVDSGPLSDLVGAQVPPPHFQPFFGLL
jgi:hypothetical protein